MANNGYVQIPPDSTGKKIDHVILLELVYQSGTTVFEIGDNVTGNTSGVTGTVVKVDGTVSAGDLYISVDRESPIAFVDGEDLLVGGMVYALANGTGTLYYRPTVSIVDHENPFNGVDVSADGGLIITTKEGNFRFDSHGFPLFSQQNILISYTFPYDSLPDHFSTNTSSDAFVTHSSDYNGLLFSTSTASGSYGSIQGVYAAKLEPGTSLHYKIALVSGDTGKDNLYRRWGAYDESSENGAYFESSGSSVNIVFSSNTSGTTVVQTVSQSAWNSDRLDGSGGEFNISQNTLDISKYMIYWIELGPGCIRYGVEWNNTNVVCHTLHTVGQSGTTFLKYGHYPIYAKQFNNDTTVSTSELKFVAGSIYSNRQSDPIVTRNFSSAFPVSKTFVMGSDPEESIGYSTIGSFRLRNTVEGKSNRAIVIPKILEFYSADHPIAFRVLKNAGNLSGSNWLVTYPGQEFLNDVSEFDVDGVTSGSYGSNAYPIWCGMVPAGQTRALNWNDDFSNSERIVYKSDAEPQTYTLQAITLDGSPSASVSLLLSWQLYT